MGFGLFGMTWLAPQTQVKGDHVGESIWVYNAAAFFIPWCLVAAILAFIWLRDVPVKANIKQHLDIFSNTTLPKPENRNMVSMSAMKM